MEYMGLACPPLDLHHLDFGFFTATDSIPAGAADHRQSIDDLCGFFDDFDHNGDLLIKGSQHLHQHQAPVAGAAVAVEKKSITLKTKVQHGKGKELKLLLTLKKPPAHGKGKQMKLLLQSKNQTKPPSVNEARTEAAEIITNNSYKVAIDHPSSMSKKPAAPAIADHHHPPKVQKVEVVVDQPKLESQARKRVVSRTKTTAVANEDNHEHKIEVSIQKVLHKYEKVAEDKRKRQAVVIDSVPPKPKFQPNKSSSCRFKSKKLQKLYNAHRIFH